MRSLQSELEQRRNSGLYRRRKVAESAAGPEIEFESRRLLNFCSNDYLGLANDPTVKAAFIRAAEQWGCGSGAAHLISGHSTAHHRLEEQLADFTGRERALLFSTGYMANLGVAGALLGRNDTVFEDRLNHASLLDAGLLSGARLKRYRHADPDHLLALLQQQSTGEKLVMTDGVFSMDGDIAPLKQLAGICQQTGAWLMVDDAHGLGVLSADGRGTTGLLNLDQDQVPILMGTLGKAFGAFGAFVAGSEALIETLIQNARTYIYTTALPPAIAEATSASLEIIRHDNWRRVHLQQLISRFKQQAEQLGLPCMPSDTPIQPLLIGSAQRALELSERLMEQGIMLSAIRPPTVPKNTARLRITFSAAHTDKHLQQLMNALEQVFTKPAIS